jgi:hypothetical protein
MKRLKSLNSPSTAEEGHADKRDLSEWLDEQ